MAYRIFHIFTNSPTPSSTEQSYTVKHPLVRKILLRLGVLKPLVKAPDSDSFHFRHSVLSPLKLQEIIKDQVAHLRSHQLSPICIFIGSQDYVQMCEYSDLSLIEQVSYVESIKLVEEFSRTFPVSSNDTEIKQKVFEFIAKESQSLLNKQYQRLPGSLIVSGYKFLNLPLVILPWLSGVFVAPDLSDAPAPNTTII